MARFSVSLLQPKTTRPPENQPFAAALEILSDAHEREVGLKVADLLEENAALKGEIVHLQARVQNALQRERPEGAPRRAPCPRRPALYQDGAPASPGPASPSCRRPELHQVHQVLYPGGTLCGKVSETGLQAAVALNELGSSNRVKEHLKDINGRAEVEEAPMTNRNVSTVEVEEDGWQYEASVVKVWQTLVGRAIQAAQRSVVWPRKVWNDSLQLLQNEMLRFDNQELDLIQDMALRLASSRGGARMNFLDIVKMKAQVASSAGVTDAQQIRKGRIPKIAIHPQSKKRILWAITGMLLMLFDVVMLPLGAFPLGEHNALDAMILVSQIYWTLDIFVSFITGVYMDSRLEMRISAIAKVYVTGWFPLDCLITMPLWAVFYLPDDGGGDATGSSLKMARNLRLLRFLRLVRFLKFEHTLNETLAFINSSVVILSIKICKLMGTLVLLVHIIACVWYAVGDAHESGWTREEPFAEGGTLYAYLSASHWALTQFQGTSDVLPGRSELERMYAVFTVLFSLLGLSSFVSSLTNMMMQLTRLHDEKLNTNRMICGYLKTQKVSSALSVRVKRYVEWSQNLAERRRYDERVLEELPIQLRLDVLEEVRTPVLIDHPLFYVVQSRFPQIVRRICGEAMEVQVPSPQEVIFGSGDECRHMYFIVDGQATYTRDSLSKKNETTRTDPNRVSYRSMDAAAGAPPAELGEGSYLCEAALWIDWKHCGRFDIGSEASILRLKALEFGQIAPSDPTAFASLVLYSRRFAAAVNCLESFSDLFDLLPELRDMGLVTSTMSAMP